MNDRELYQSIASLPSLEPSPLVDSLFSALVDFTESGRKISLSREEVRELQELCSRAESRMEFSFANFLLRDADKEKTLRDFKYYENYMRLSELEYINLSFCSTQKKIQSILFVGGGPLPLSAIFLAREKGIPVTVLEKDERVAAISREIIQALDLSSLITIIRGDALTFASYAHFDAVYMAALVGETKTVKEEIISHIYKEMSPESLLLIRSVFGSRELLYTKVDKEFLSKFPVVLEVRPHKVICNSFFIIQKT